MATVRAPEIDVPGLQWFNTDQPLSIESLRGKIVILDFWTFCCINCMHILPTLRRIEQTFPDDIVVIGIHTPKFASEREPSNVRNAIARYDIRHPVAHDPTMQIWQQYGVRSWPTLMFVGPDGNILGQAPGEPDADQLIEVLGNLVSEAKSAGVLSPDAFPLATPEPQSSRFSFPGKLKPFSGVGAENAAWALTDGGHHQIVLLDRAGNDVSRIGSGDRGFKDGSLAVARFNSPEGLIADGDVIYVADTFNHAIRRIDLAAGEVSTLAGTGKRGGALNEPAHGVSTALASPWDLELKGNSLYFANAGTHQLGQYDISSGMVSFLAGNSAENIIDGPAAGAQLAQPSGLAFNEDKSQIYFADSETSAIRAVHLDDMGSVTTLVGAGLFDFGHVNGPFETARLQHPLGLTLRQGKILVADSYNHVIRTLDPITREVSDFDDEVFTCMDDICYPAQEPAGIVTDENDNVMLVDTNNHRILKYEPDAMIYKTWAS